MQAAIFDFGGVLIKWDAWALFQTVCKTRAEFDRFLNEGRFYAFLDRADAGESFSKLVSEMKPEHVRLAQIYIDRHLEAVTGFDLGVIEIIHELKARGTKLFGLTNWSREMFPATRKLHPVFDAFDDIMVSGEEGIRKPAPAIFARAIERWEINPKHSMFIDDVEENVTAAKAMGFGGIVFQTSQQLREVLCTQT